MDKANRHFGWEEDLDDVTVNNLGKDNLRDGLRIIEKGRVEDHQYVWRTTSNEIAVT